MQKIFQLLLVASAIVLGTLWFLHWSKIRALNSGEVHVHVEAQNTPAKQNGTIARGVTSSPPDQSPDALPQNEIASLPASETTSPHPPNGIVAVGRGKFQLYRQGDLTFRLNTETGQACVLFATVTQWSKPLVYDHGCASH
jgi:hypothetical protein